MLKNRIGQGQKVAVVLLVIIMILICFACRNKKGNNNKSATVTDPLDTTDTWDTTLKSSDSPFAFTAIPYPPDAAVLGAKWLRYGGDKLSWREIEPRKGEFKWDETDKIAIDASRSDMKVFITIASLDRWVDTTGKPPRPGLSGDELVHDEEEYKVFLKNLVERYDGDGIDDAPGSPVVDVWQIENETDLDMASGWSGVTPKIYARLLKESYKAIKQENPEIKVAMTGVGLLSSGLEDFFIPVFEELNKMNDTPNGKYFDIFDFHWYPFFDRYNHFQEDKDDKHISIYLDEYIKKIDQLLIKYGYGNTPVYITEMGQYSDTPLEPGRLFNFRSERNQAVELFKLYVYPLIKGVKKIFWVTITEWPAKGAFDNMGLINNPMQDGKSHKKLAYYTYKKMTEILDSSNWNNIKTIMEKDGVYIYQFIKRKNNSVIVAWNDNEEAKEISIKTSLFNSKKVKITKVVPKHESGKEIVSDAVFETQSLQINPGNSGEFKITLADNPVFMENE